MNYFVSSRLFNSIIKFILLLCLIQLACDLSVNTAVAAMGREEAKQFLINRVIAGDSNEGNLMCFGPQNMLSAGDVVAPFIIEKQPYPGVSRTLDKDTWFFWINDDINDYFSHPTRFVYIDADHPNPTIGDGIIIDDAGWWPKINGIDYYRYSSDRTEASSDWVYGQLPLEPQQSNSSITSEQEVVGLSSNVRATEVYFDWMYEQLSIEPNRESLSIVSKKEVIEISNGVNSANTYAIIISGESNSVFQKSMDNFQAALQNSTTGPGIPSSNIITESNCSYNNFVNHITSMNSNNADSLYILIVAHGAKEGIVMNDTWQTSQEIADAIGQTSASNVYVVTESCYDGTLVDEIESTGVADIIITATDGEHPAKGRGYWILTSGGSFIKELTEHWQNGQEQIPITDAYYNVVNADCALWDIWCMDAKEQGPTIDYGPSASIPTLSEWKKIFLSLLMLCLVMGFATSRSGRYAISHNIVSNNSVINKPAFEQRIFYTALKWVLSAVVLCITGAIVLKGYIDVLDIFGTLFCAPLVAYIIHLVVLCKCDDDHTAYRTHF